MDIALIAPAERRTILRASLQPHRLVAEAGDLTALWLLLQLAPDIVILDCTMPQINPLHVIPMLTASGAQVVALGGPTAEDRAFLHQLGASLCLPIERVPALGSVLEPWLGSGSRATIATAAPA